MSNHPLYDKIEEYITGQMSEADVISFEENLKSDQELAATVALQKLEHDAMDRMLDLDLKAKMDTWKQTPPPNPFENNPSEIKKNPPSKRWGRWLLFGLLGTFITAGIVYTIIGSPDQSTKEISEPSEPIEATQFENTIPTQEDLLEEKIEDDINEAPLTNDRPVANNPSKKLPKKNTDKPTTPKKENQYQLLAASNYQSTPLPSISSTLRSGDDTTKKSNIEKAAEAFERKQFIDAQRLIGDPSDADQSNVRYLRGHIYFNLKKYAEASKEFESITSMTIVENKEGAQWYLFLSYLAQLPNSKTQFEKLGKELAADEYFSNREKVQQLMDEVNK